MSGVGLDTAFNQDEPQQNINTHAKKDKTPDGLEKKSPKGSTPLLGNRNDPVTDGQFKGHAEQSAATRFRNFDDIASEDEREDAYRGTDYTMDKIGNAAQKTLNLERIQHAKIGETVSYNATTGTIVRKDGSYVTIYNEGRNAFDQVHAGQTSISTDTIGSGIIPQLWDQMRQEQRVASLSKAGVQEPLHFISRKWSELPMNLKDVLKLSPTSVSVGSGYKGKVPEGAHRDKPSQPAYGITTGQTRGPGQTASTTDKITNKNPTGAAAAKPAPKDEGVTFASCKSTEYISKLSPTSVSVGSGYKGKTPPGGKRDATAGQKRETARRESEAFSPDRGFGGEGSSRTFTPGGKKYEKKPTALPEKKRKPAGADAGSAADDAAARSTGEKPVVTFASGLDKSNTYGDLATALYRIRNNLNKLAPLKSPRASTERPTETRAFQSETDDLIDRTTMTQNKPTSERSGAKAPVVKKLPDSITSQVKFPKYQEPDDKTQQDPTSAEHNTHNSESDGQLGSKDSFKKSDVEHGAYGGVVTDTPIDATEDYEEDRDDIVGQEFDHNHQQKTPKDFGVPQAKDTKKEGGTVSTGAATTGTPGTFNAKYNPDEDGYKEKEKSIVNKNNTRYGPRTATREEMDRYINK